MSKEDKISIIVPVYNVEEYLPKCIESILMQTYSNLEIILVDDGSLDNSGHICDEYAEKDSRIRVIHKKNGGLSSARNAGIKAATGQFFGFIDSDDYIEPDMYQCLLMELLDNDADISLCGYDYVDQCGVVLPETHCIVEQEVCRPEEMYRKLMKMRYGYYVTVVNRLYRRYLFEHISFPEGRLHEDEFTVHHFYGACRRVACTDKILYHYVQRNSGIMGRYSLKGMEDAIAASKERKAYFLEKGLKKEAKDTLRLFYSAILRGLHRIPFEENKDIFFEKIKELVPQYIGTDILRTVRLCSLYGKKWIHMIAANAVAAASMNSALRKAKKAEGNVIFHVATPIHGNLGDQAIAYAEQRVLRRFLPNHSIVEISNFAYLKCREKMQSCVSKDDIIVIDGGGSLGTLWPWEDDKISDIIQRFKENRIIVFPQTCYYEEGAAAMQRCIKNREIYASAKQLTMMLRDHASYQKVKESFPEVETALLPDIVLSLENINQEKRRKEVLFCLRQDKEKVGNDEYAEKVKKLLEKNKISFRDTTTVVNKVILKKMRKKELFKKWKEFSSARLVITDRLHGMIFCAVTGTLCIAVDNKSAKVSGGYVWLKTLEHIRMVEDTAEVYDLVEKMLDMEWTGISYFKYPVEQLKGILLGKK